MSEAWPLWTCLELAPLPTAAACARLHAKQVLWEWGLEWLVDNAELLVSELITNAIRASWSPKEKGLVALRLLGNDERVLIEVWDQCPDDPSPREAEDDAESGRGFAVIEALSYQWGWRRVSASLKVVWCELVIKNS
jgi:anti-sigma regulatory factor (Ser/Thr protein kinase)